MRAISRRLRGPGGRALVAAALLWTVSRAVFGPPGPIVRVAWKDAAPGVRRYVERTLALHDGEEVEPGKWAYALRDTSERNRRALVEHPAIAAIDGVDRRTYAIAERMPRAQWRRGLLPVPEAIAQTFEFAAIGLAVAGAALVPAPAALTWAAARNAGARAMPGSWLQRGIPIASAEAAGVFRIVFGTLVVAFLVREPVYPELLSPFAVSQAQGVYGAAVRWFATNPAHVESIRPALAIAGSLFVVGLLTRVSFACFTLAALAWATVFTMNTSAHAISALVLTLIALVPARWGDAWSVDAWVKRRRRRPGAPSRAYGYAPWVPGLVLAVALAAAAWSKVREGPNWILNGTVKYHFVSDLEHAWVSWGPSLTRWHAVAVAMAAFAVVVEALLITAMFSRSYAYRAALGALATMLLLGFALFQGIVWPGWWLLLLAFLPWHLVGRSRQPVASEGLPAPATWTQIAAVCLVLAQQVFVTLRHVEARPMFSTYDMYSTTYATPEAYEAASNLVYRVVAVTERGAEDLPACVVDDRVAGIAERALAGSGRHRELLKQAIGRCLREAPDVRQVALEGDRQVYLWEEARFEWKRRLDVIGPIPADLLRD